jgi:exopolysaccharide biosynthesis operon protein EpsL
MFSRGYPIALAAFFAMSTGPTLALDGDRIRPSVGFVANYSSNLFYVDDRLPDRFYPFLRDGQKSDLSYGARLGLDADIPWSRQLIAVRAQATNNRYVTYDNLDYVGYNFGATLNWVVGSDWDGDAGWSRGQSLGSFVDTRLNVRNLRTAEDLFGSALFRIAPDWKLRAGLRNSRLDNSQASFRSGNYDVTSLEAGSRYFSKGGDNYVGGNLRYSDGRFPERVFVPGVSTTSNRYTQYDLEGTVDWHYSGLSMLSGFFGLTVRQSEGLSQRDFAGPTARLTGVYGLDGITALNVTLRRELTFLETATANATLVQGVSFGPSFQWSEKLLAQANYSYSERKYLDNPGFIANPFPDRKDRIQGLSGTVAWAPLRKVQVSATLSYDKRTSNAPFSNYDAVSMFVSGQITF